MALFRGPKITTTGLILALDAANKNSYPGSGTSWKDLSGNNNTGTLTNGPTFSAANMGCIVFDGSNDYANITTTSLFNFSTGDFSVDIWYTISSNSGSPNDWVSPFSKGGYNNGDFATLLNRSPGHPDNKKIRFYVGGSARLIVDQESVATNVVVNKWYNYSVSRISGVVYAYVFGNLAGSTSFASSISNSNNITIAASVGGASEYPLDGKVSMFKIYNRGLSASEVLQNYNATKSRFGY